MNRVILIGNLARDPEITTTTNGVSVANFSIAVQRRYTNAEGEREADFINVVVWRALAENVHKYLKKGSKAAVSGTLQTRNYEAADGTRRYVTEVVADEVEFLNTRSSDSNTGAQRNESVAQLEPVDDNDLPF